MGCLGEEKMTHENLDWSGEMGRDLEIDGFSCDD